MQLYLHSHVSKRYYTLCAREQEQGTDMEGVVREHVVNWTLKIMCYDKYKVLTVLKQMAAGTPGKCRWYS